MKTGENLKTMYKYNVTEFMIIIMYIVIGHAQNNIASCSTTPDEVWDRRDGWLSATFRLEEGCSIITDKLIETHYTIFQKQMPHQGN